jgi:hypothetical protein
MLKKRTFTMYAEFSEGQDVGNGIVFEPASAEELEMFETDIGEELAKHLSTNIAVVLTSPVYIAKVATKWGLSDDKLASMASIIYSHMFFPMQIELRLEDVEALFMEFDLRFKSMLVEIDERVKSTGFSRYVVSENLLWLIPGDTIYNGWISLESMSKQSYNCIDARRPHNEMISRSNVADHAISTLPDVKSYIAMDPHGNYASLVVTRDYAFRFEEVKYRYNGWSDKDYMIHSLRMARSAVAVDCRRYIDHMVCKSAASVVIALVEAHRYDETIKIWRKLESCFYHDLMARGRTDIYIALTRHGTPLSEYDKFIQTVVEFLITEYSYEYAREHFAPAFKKYTQLQNSFEFDDPTHLRSKCVIQT